MKPNLFLSLVNTYTMKVQLLAIVIAQLFTYSVKSQDQSAIRVLESVAKGFAGDKVFKINGSGTFRSDLHMANPMQLNLYEYRFQLIGNLRSDALYVKHFYQRNGKLESQIRKYSNQEEFVYDEKKKVYIKSNLENETNPETETNWRKSYAPNPYLLIQYLLKNKKNISLSASKAIGTHFIDFTMPNKEQWVLQIDEKSLLCINMKRSYFHQLFGDVSEEIHWEKYAKTEQGNFPTQIRIMDKSYEQYTIEQKITFDNNLPLDNKVDSVQVEKLDKIDRTLVSRDSIAFSKIVNGLYQIELKQTNNRLMVAEFDDFLILLESSYNSKNGDLMIEFINEKFPNKPIRYASFSHSHYIGFARNYAANGISVITTEDNAQFIQKLSSRPFTLRPDKQEKLKRQPIFEKLIDNSWKYADDFNAMEVYNIASSHTDNYMMFYFPRQKTVFIGDLLWIWENGKPISGRTLVFYNEIVRLGLDVKKYYISWPLKGYAIKNIVNSDEFFLPKP
jgi:hypothetical protein